MGGIIPGLWRINANDGSVTAISASRTQPMQLIGAPRQDTTGHLYYLYGEEDNSIFQNGKSRATLSLVRSDADGVTNRIPLRSETFRVMNAVWTPDDRGLVIIQFKEGGVQPDNLILVPTDSAQPVITLPVDATTIIGSSLRWGL